MVCTKCVQSGHMSHCGQDRTDFGWWGLGMRLYSGWFVQSVYEVVTCLSVVRIEQTLVAVVDQCTCASGIVTVDS